MDKPIVWSELFSTLDAKLSLLVIGCAYLFFIFLYVTTFLARKGNKIKQKYAIKGPGILISLLIQLFPALSIFFLLVYKNDWRGDLETMSYFIAYLTLQFMVIEMRIRFNRAILSSDEEPYQKLQDFNSSNWAWAFGIVFFPLFYVPYSFWYFAQRRKMRKASRKCAKCYSVLSYDQHVISEQEEDKFLTKGQVKEEYLKSREWDVWSCANCASVFILGYKAVVTKIQNCKACNNITEVLKDTIIHSMPDAYSEGRGTRKYECSACGLKREEEFKMSRTRHQSKGIFS